MPARPVLVLDGERGAVVELDHVGLADEAEPVGPQGQGPLNADTPVPLAVGAVDGLVDGAAAERVEVLVPGLVQVDQAALARAVAPVLQRRDDNPLQGFVREGLDVRFTVRRCTLAAHGHWAQPTRRVKVTPAGKSASSTVTA